MGIDYIKRSHGNMYSVYSGHVQFRVERSIPSADYWRVFSDKEELYASASLCKCFDFIDDLMRYSPE